MTGTAPHKHNARCSQSKKQLDAHKVKVVVSNPLIILRRGIEYSTIPNWPLKVREMKWTV